MRRSIANPPAPRLGVVHRRCPHGERESGAERFVVRESAVHVRRLKFVRALTVAPVVLGREGPLTRVRMTDRTGICGLAKNLPRGQANSLGRDVTTDVI
jgi:hypothetical protein